MAVFAGSLMEDLDNPFQQGAHDIGLYRLGCQMLLLLLLLRMLQWVLPRLAYHKVGNETTVALGVVLSKRTHF